MGVHLPDSGGVLLAARKTISRHSNSIMRAQCDKLFARELEGLRAGRACPYFVRRLGDAEYEDRFELLLELASGGTLEGELVRQGTGDERVLRRGSGGGWAKDVGRMSVLEVAGEARRGGSATTPRTVLARVLTRLVCALPVCRRRR